MKYPILHIFPSRKKQPEGVCYEVLCEIDQGCRGGGPDLGGLRGHPDRRGGHEGPAGPFGTGHGTLARRHYSSASDRSYSFRATCTEIREP